MVKFDRFVLDNGLTVIVHRDKSTPIVAMNIIYKVGSRDENPDKTGFAHLFEHLMFGGSVNIPKYDEPLQLAGGENNAFTNSDYTDYYLTIPKNNLEIGFWLESDRMLDLAFTPKSLDVQRQVVVEEFKQNYLNQPYGDVYLLLNPLAYKVHPYQWPTIGKNISHIENATMDDVKAFYKKFYNPDNAILTVAGDVDTAHVKELAAKWFGTIRKKSDLGERSYPEEPEQTEPRSKTVHRKVPQDAIYMAWHTSVRNSKTYYDTDLLSDILSNGESSRMYRTLIKDKKLFSDINAFITGDLDKGLFIVTGKLMNGVKMEDAEKAIDTEIEKIRNELVTKQEYEKVINKIEANLVYSRLSVLNKAMNLCYYEMLGDADIYNHEQENYRNVTRESLRETAQRIFAPVRKNTLYYFAEKS
jgi:predicted Zn-dependent peptidase